MPLPPSDWTSVYGAGGFDSASNMPDQTDETTPGADDGHPARSSSIESLRDSLIEAETQVGDPTSPANSSLLGLAKQAGTIEAVFSEKATPEADDKVLIEDSAASGAKKWTTLSSLISKVVGSPINWNRLSTTNPAGVSASPSFVWQFDGTASSLNDRTANGVDLSLAGGTEIYQDIVGGHPMLWFDGSTNFTSPADTDHQIVGEGTWEFVIHPSQANGGANNFLLLCAGPTDAEADNSLYQFTGNANFLRWDYFSEHGAGVNDSATFDAVPMLGIMQHVVFTRDASGNLSCYVNGSLVDGAQSVTAPTGGSNSTLNLGLNLIGGLSSIRGTKEEFSAAAVLESYNTLVGG